MESLLMDMKEKVAERYRSAAVQMLDGADSSCCGGSTCGDQDYEEMGDMASVSLGCGVPTSVAALEPGETVLDLGSGGGLDVIMSARRVAPGGRAIGVDMTEEMLELARRNAQEAGVDNVEFLLGEIEDLPLADGAVDVIISNCVINLSTDKPLVFAEMARVLRRGGRIGISDIVAEDGLTREEISERGSWVGCIAGALTESEYRHGLAAVGFTDVEVEFTSEAAVGLHNTIIRGRLV